MKINWFNRYQIKHLQGEEKATPPPILVRAPSTSKPKYEPSGGKVVELVSKALNSMLPVEDGDKLIVDLAMIRSCEIDGKEILFIPENYIYGYLIEQ